MSDAEPVDLAFGFFMNEVDALVFEETGQFSADFPDWDWWGAYAGPLTVDQVVQQFFKDMEGYEA